jgi:predicted HNH restriction endonuclease
MIKMITLKEAKRLGATPAPDSTVCQFCHIEFPDLYRLGKHIVTVHHKECRYHLNRRKLEWLAFWV